MQSILLFLDFSTFLIFGSNALEYSNRWTVQIDGDNDEAERVARKHGFVNHGKVIDDFYSFQNNKVDKISSLPSSHAHQGLLSEPNVKMVEQQEMKCFTLLSSESVNFHDPNDRRWTEMWYINRIDGPTHNVIDVWKRNFTGEGVIVAVVDEGFDPEHPEIKANYIQNASLDVIDNDTIPLSSTNDPQYGHGEKSAGVIAAVFNNSNCGVGLAYNAKLGGIRLFYKEKASDADTARALSHATNLIDIYSNSWGPNDKGLEVEGPGPFTQRALKNGAEKGRGGLGSIYVFAAGNGGVLVRDSCAFNGYVNNIYTIAITGIRSDGNIPVFGERCAAIMAVTYTKDILEQSNKVITADTNKACTGDFGASSAAAAMASGLIALMLSANRDLSWRDVQHIIVRTARQDVISYRCGDWNRNKAGLRVNDYVGFGFMDARKMIDAAIKWKRVPPKVNCSIPRRGINRTIKAYKTSEFHINLTDWSNSCNEPINYLEHVEVSVNLTYTLRGELLIKLISPQGTVSNLTHYRKADAAFGAKDLNWVLMTLHHWGENANGLWKLTLESSHPYHNNEGKLYDWTLILHGTTTDPLENNTHVPVLKPANKINYIVQLSGWLPQNDYWILLFGNDGKTCAHKLTLTRRYWNVSVRFLEYSVGVLTKVHLIQSEAKSIYITKVVVRQEGGEKKAVFIWRKYSAVKVISITRDVDECEESLHKCHFHADCTNTVGSYSCRCKPGYFGDGLTCKKDVDECKDSLHRCNSHADCTNTAGSYLCHCKPGYFGDGLICKERNCKDPGQPQNGGRIGNKFEYGSVVIFWCKSPSYVLVGASRITCKKGKWSDKTPSCEDVDECKHSLHRCNFDADCTNTAGSYLCRCKPGYFGDGLICKERNCKDPGQPQNGERIGDSFGYGSNVTFWCQSPSYVLVGASRITCKKGKWSDKTPSCEANGTCGGVVCDQHSSCLPRAPGSRDRQCICLDGWTGDGKSCTDVNECESSSTKCDLNATCFNTPGSYQCRCRFGYQGNETHCVSPCSDPGLLENGFRVGDDYHSGAVVKFNCNSSFALIGQSKIVCKNGQWSGSKPTCSDCGWSLGTEKFKIGSFRISSPDSRNIPLPRLHGNSSWCTSGQTYLKIHLGEKPSRYKVTAIATQGGADQNLWVKQYTLRFRVGNIEVPYKESETPKIIEGNKDSNSVVIYHLKKPFVTKELTIIPVVSTSPICLRTEIYGCHPADCILLGSRFWGLWTQRDNSSNYYRVFISRINNTHIEFILQLNNNLKRTYNRTAPVLIINRIPEKQEISVNAPVIAVHKPTKPEWYRTGTVKKIVSDRGEFKVKVKFDNGDSRSVLLTEIRLAKRPRFC